MENNKQYRTLAWGCCRAGGLERSKRGLLPAGLAAERRTVGGRVI